MFEHCSPYTKRICDKLDFEVAKELVWADYKVDGELLFPNTEVPTCPFVFKMLNKAD